MSQNSKDYKNGKIYCIRNNIDDDIYVGSTTQRLSKRMAKHREDAKHKDKMHRNLYVKMLEHGLEHFYIELIEDCPCETLEQLRKQEGHYIRKMGTLNGSIAGRTKHEWREDNIEYCKEKDKTYHQANKEKHNLQSKKWREEHPEDMKRYKKEWYEANKDKLRELQIKYQEQNKDKIRERQNKYQEQNKDKIKEYQQKYREQTKEKMICVCGGKYTLAHKKQNTKEQRNTNNIFNNVAFLNKLI